MLRPEVALARKARREMSYPEVLLWQRLRRSPVGLHFRHQHPIGPYIVDFYCARSRLAVEVDGEIHADPARLVSDDRRTAFLRDNGFSVLRVNARRILADADGTADAIVALAARPLHHRPAAGGPPPRAGEDQGS